MNDPLISIVVPFVNEEKYIADCIASLINQTYQNIEIVLVNDHSTDQSKSICLSINDSRIKYVDKSHIPKGEAFARNFGIEAATGEIITFLDADDTCAPNRVQLQFDKLLKNGINNTICGCWVQKSGLETQLLEVPTENDDIIKGFNRQYKRVTIVGATIMAAKKLFEQVPYRTKFKYYTDWDLLLRMYETKTIRFVNVDTPLYNYIIRRKGTKYQKDWLDFNIFLRDCQFRRRKGEKEYDSPEQMFAGIRQKEILKYLSYRSFQKLIQLKRFLRI